MALIHTPSANLPSESSALTEELLSQLPYLEALQKPSRLSLIASVDRILFLLAHTFKKDHEFDLHAPTVLNCLLWPTPAEAKPIAHRLVDDLLVPESQGRKDLARQVGWHGYSQNGLFVDDPFTGLPFGPSPIDRRLPIVDLACGPRAAAYLGRIPTDWNYIGVDYSPYVCGVLEAARAGRPHLQIIEADLCSVPFEQSSIGHIFWRNVEPYAPDADERLPHLFDALAPGGRMRVQTWRSDVHSIGLMVNWKKPVDERMKEGWRVQIGFAEMLASNAMRPVVIDIEKPAPGFTMLSGPISRSSWKGLCDEYDTLAERFESKGESDQHGAS